MLQFYKATRYLLVERCLCVVQASTIHKHLSTNFTLRSVVHRVSGVLAIDEGR